MEIRPQNPCEFLSAHKLPWGFEQTMENLKRFLLQFNAHSELTELPFPQVDFENAELNPHGNHTIA